MELGELLSALGTPARLGARILFIPRYLVHGFESLRRWRHNTYARTRFGATFVWRVWLLFDVAKLEALEVLLNEGSDEEVLNMRDTRLESFWTVALVGALLASIALQALNLPLLTETSFVVRAAFNGSLMLSLLATFFTCIQQRELSVVRSAPALRAWLSNGVRYTNVADVRVFQSSFTALCLMESPYEYLSMAIANFIAGMAAYVGSAWLNGVRLHAENGELTELAVVVYFAVGTGFAFTLFPVLLGCKDRESRAVGDELDGFGKSRPELLHGRTMTMSEPATTKSRSASFRR